jgi:hypothetical protein
MLSEADYQEAVRRYKNMKVNGHERQQFPLAQRDATRDEKRYPAMSPPLGAEIG